MIRQTADYDLDQQHQAACQDTPVSCVTWFIPPALPEGIATWPTYGDQDLPLLSAQSVVEFSTADPPQHSRLRRDNELQLLEDTRAYLHCLAEGVEPDRIFFTMVFLSSLVAAFGLIRNDLAIIIGAMVIAPLLMPNVALALATTLADKDLWRRAIKANLLGMALALTIAALLGLILAPTLEELKDGEIFKRTAPQLADLLLAIISGVAGTLALTAGLSSTVIGVMVAVALMPHHRWPQAPLSRCSPRPRSARGSGPQLSAPAQPP